MKLKKVIISLVVFLVFASMWQLLATFNLYNKELLPPPNQSLAAVFRLGKEGILWSDIAASMSRYVPGFIIGSLIGIVIGLITGIFRRTGYAINPLFHYFRSIPSVALIPFMLVLFGLGNLGKISLVAWACMFPVWLSTQAGVRQVPKEYLQASRIFGIKGIRQVSQVLLPCTMPYIVNGLRVAVSTGLFALAAAEIFAGSSGIGFRIEYSYQLFQTDTMVGMILLLGLIAFLADLLLSVVGLYAAKWDTT